MSQQYSPNRTGTASSTPSSVERQARDMANAAGEKISDTVEQAQALAQDQYDKLTANIRRNPLQAAGIAAGIGFVLALLARR
jgi:ElaB/YqjD/DUF883 family membrane-anchored ribosome-binding protein